MRVEMRGQLPEGSAAGTWPAFWLLPTAMVRRTPSLPLQTTVAPVKFGRRKLLANEPERTTIGAFVQLCVVKSQGTV